MQPLAIVKNFDIFEQITPYTGDTVRAGPLFVGMGLAAPRRERGWTRVFWAMSTSTLGSQHPFTTMIQSTIMGINESDPPRWLFRWEGRKKH